MTGPKSSLIAAVNGPAGIGKTTVSRLLAQALPNSVCIHGDALRDFVVRRDDEGIQKGLAYKDAQRGTEAILDDLRNRLQLSSAHNR